MKKIFNILILLFAFVNANAQAQPTACCPEFKLAFKRDVECTQQGSCVSAIGGNTFTASNCKYSTNSFLVTPNLPGYTYAWIITGGTPSLATGNPVNITWGGGSSGTIIVTITSADGSCVKTIKENICLRDAPVASFTFNPNNACAGSLISFNNTSVGGANVYWDFGDGSFGGNYNNITHTYTLPGSYNVTIYVSNDTTPCKPISPAGGNRPCCGCTSSFTLVVNVVAGSPLTIIPKNCINQCLCPGDTAEYCISQSCTSYTWSITGGVFIPPTGNNTQCVKVKWTGPYPTTISFSGTCSNPCGNTATLSVPVLVNNIPIQPNILTACQNSTQTYSLPAMPGVFYNWAVTGGTIIGPNINTPVITVLWGPGTTGQVSCTYQNPLKKKCSGSSVLNISLQPVLKITGPSQTCVGCTAFFSTMGGSVTWTGSVGLGFSPSVGPGTTVSFPVSAIMNTYTITATGAFCNSPVSANMVVAPKPVLTITPVSAIACPNTPVQFVATSTVTNTPISWVLPAGASMVANTGPQMDTAIIQFGTIPLAGVTVTATQNCAFNLACSQATASATVKKPLAPILNPVTNPCIDQTILYSISNPVPGIYYTWSISNNLGTILSGQGTGTISVLWHGNMAVSNTGTITVSNCGGSTSANITVALPINPVITQSGGCFPFTLTCSPANNYLWSGPGITGPTNQQTVTITLPGTYTVIINSNINGKCPETKTYTVPPDPYFVTILPPCIVSSCNLNTLNVPFTVGTNIPNPQCQWFFIPQNQVIPIPAPGGNICNGFSGTQLGTYFLVITNPATGCKDTSNRVRIPEDINICCATAACNSLPPNAIDFTFTGCSPTIFTGSFTLPPGWSTGSLPITYCFGDGTSQTGPSLNATHQYPAAGQYTACIVRKIFKPSGIPGVNDTCCVSNCHSVTIPVVTKFNASYNCNTGLLTMTDASSYFPSNAGASYSWSYTGTYTGSLTNGPNQSITPTNSGTFTITLSITLNGCTSTYSMPILIVLPVAPITINPNPTCDGSPVFFSTTPGMISYNWQFGDNNFSYLASPEHIYPGPGTYSVTLTVTTPQGCVIIKTATVTVQPRPIVTLSPNPVTICPGTSVTLTANINANGNTMCPVLSSYTFQWYYNGSPAGPPTNSPVFNATLYGTYYAVLTGNIPGCNCKIVTDTATVKWYPKPVAKIKGSSTVCLNFGSGTVVLSNAVGGYPTYNWSSNNPPNISFSPNNASSTTVTIIAPGNYQIFLDVTDANGCKAYDTLCIYATNSPSVIINSPAGNLCAGKVYSLLAVPTPATAPPAGYSYLWNNGAVANPINVSAPGAYDVLLTDMNTGCSATSNFVFINQGPELSLFPSCCDTICDTAKLIIVPPLPLITGQNACVVYNIVWLDNNVPISPQPSPCNALNTATLIPLLGLHTISIAVTINGCTDTSKVYNLFIKHCGGCDCKESHWGGITLTPGDPAAPNANVVTGNPIILQCKNNYPLKCNQSYTLNASFICKDTACNGKVTYSLQPPVGLPLTGTLPITFTPNQNGVYILTLYGWCGGKKCDSCTIDLSVKCDPCDCKGSKWGNISLSDGIPDNNPIGSAANPKVFTNPTNISLSCGKTYKLDCNKPYTFNANYICKDGACNGKVTYSLQPPTGNAVIGSVAAGFTPTQSGTYTLTLYGWCGNKICDSCVIKFDVKCVPGCDCKGSHWGEMTVSDDVKTSQLSCKKEYPWKCKVPFTINATFNCSDPACKGSVSYTLIPPSGSPVSGNVPFTYTPTQSGTYTVTLYGMCGTTICDSCPVKFIVGPCPVDTNCCKHQIKIDAGNVTYTPTANSTIAGKTFTISGLSGVSLTEVRAEVVSYDISSNFNNECLGCKTFPFTWASISNAANIGAVPPKITLFGGNTTTLFNPTGTAVYQNPREVIWNNGNTFMINSPVGINFILPPQPLLDCCELKGKICVKFTFRDDQCNECEVIVCFDVVIKKK